LSRREDFSSSSFVREEDEGLADEEEGRSLIFLRSQARMVFAGRVQEGGKEGRREGEKEGRREEGWKDGRRGKRGRRDGLKKNSM
jgi:hypothetical protein